jgi:hypothetical protein
VVNFILQNYHHIQNKMPQEKRNTYISRSSKDAKEAPLKRVSAHIDEVDSRLLRYEQQLETIKKEIKYFKQLFDEASEHFGHSWKDFFIKFENGYDDMELYEISSDEEEIEEIPPIQYNTPIESIEEIPAIQYTTPHEPIKSIVSEPVIDINPVPVSPNYDNYLRDVEYDNWIYYQRVNHRQIMNSDQTDDSTNDL